MSNPVSSYYPRRARWYSPLLLMPRGALRGLALDRIRLPQGVPLLGGLCSFVVPGLGIYLRGHRFWGKIAMAACALLTLVFFAGLGTFVGNAAFGLIVSIHVTSVNYAFEPWLAGARLRTRLFFSVCALFVLATVCYMPLRNLVEESWLTPLNVKGQIVIVRRLEAGRGLVRGTWIAYNYQGSHGNGLYVPDGISLGPVLALAGDRVRFGKTAFEVNGVSQPPLPNMPVTGEWVVPEKHWFVWPEVDIRGHGYVPPGGIAAALWQMGTITDSQIIGKPPKRWLWRRQV